jgi:hypothetical protein
MLFRLLEGRKPMKATIIVRLLRLVWTNVIRDECLKLAGETESTIDDTIIMVVDNLLAVKLAEG